MAAALPQAACLALSLLLLAPAIHAVAPQASKAGGKYCVVDVKLRQGGVTRLGGLVTSPLQAGLESLQQGAVYGTVSIVFPQGGGPGRLLARTGRRCSTITRMGPHAPRTAALQLPRAH